ncbi:MAG TPA: ABC transporter permease [Gemmatimonadaceae bacterium]|nr:ABC transporter permease [Gemmatimonadaceae bacterium]
MAAVSIADFRGAARGLVRSPAVAVSAVLCLALGIGATTAISSAIHRALLSALPFRAPDRLVAVFRTTPQTGPQGTWPQSVPNYLDLAHATHQLSALAAVSRQAGLVNTRGEGRRVLEVLVSGNLFPMLGVSAQHGRLILPADDELNQPAVAVLSDEFWHSAFGADPGLVGRTITVDGQPTTVIGIAPPRFQLPIGPQLIRGDIWQAIRFTPGQVAQRRTNYLQLTGRLAPGATVQSAQAELRGLFAGLVASFPQLHGENVRVAALQPASVTSVRTPLLLLFGAVTLVLLIAATNVAALLLARGVQRQREMAVRTALGATRWDAMRVALAESLLVTLVGTVLGLGLAVAGVRTIGTLAAAQLPQLDGLGLDVPVIAFAVALAIVVALVCGAVPAWRSASVDPQDALRASRGASREQHRALRLLVVFEIGLSVVLLIGAGLVLKGFARLLSNDPGFETAHVLTLDVTVPPSDYPHGSSVQRFLQPALAAIEAQPGVASAAAISSMPYITWGNNSNIRYEGRGTGEDPTQLPLVEMRVVTPSFFAVTEQKLVAGRLLRASDDERPTSPPVTVVNQALARRDFPGESAVGKRFYMTDTSFATIVGVVSDIRNMGPIETPAPEMYWTYAQGGADSDYPLMVRVTRGDPAAVLSEVRAAIHGVNANVAVSHVIPMHDVIEQSLGQPRFYLSLLGTFAVVAILLAIAGLYGVLGYAVAQRTREMGIRAALGGSVRSLVELVMRDGMRIIAFGLVGGLVGGWAATRVIQSMLYGVSPLDVPTWVGAVVLMVVVGLLAALVPALRAGRVDPVIAMREE